MDRDTFRDPVVSTDPGQGWYFGHCLPERYENVIRRGVREDLSAHTPCVLPCVLKDPSGSQPFVREGWKP